MRRVAATFAGVVLTAVLLAGAGCNSDDNGGTIQPSGPSRPSPTTTTAP